MWKTDIAARIVKENRAIKRYIQNRIYNVQEEGQDELAQVSINFDETWDLVVEDINLIIK